MLSKHSEINKTSEYLFLFTLLEKIANKDITAAKHLLSYVGLVADKYFEELLPKLTLQANHNLTAAFVLMRLYCGKYDENHLLRPHFQHLTPAHREKLATSFAKIAIALGSDEARCFYMSSLLTGKVGCIHANKSLLEDLYEMTMRGSMQAGQYDFGCYYSGKMPNGEPIDRSIIPTSILKIDKEKSICALTNALYGNNITIINKTFDRIYEFFSNNPHNSTINAKRIISYLNEQTQHSCNYLIAIYLAYVFCPREFRSKINISSYPIPNYLTLLADNVSNQSLEVAKDYLRLTVIKSNNSIYRDLATSFFNQLQQVQTTLSFQRKF